jgi:hypothetical protein
MFSHLLDFKNKLVWEHNRIIDELLITGILFTLFWVIKMVQ